MNTGVAVIIPVYKSRLDEYEKISFKQCFKVLYNHTIFLIYPKDLNIIDYSNSIAKIETNKGLIKFISFENKYFNSIKGYNRLMLSEAFYKRFEAYKYILIYQLDAYIFQDNILEWCDQDYDYIGAPWINNYWSGFYAKHLTLTRTIATKCGYKNFNEVGNGGFSLRKTKSFIQNLTIFKKQAKSFSLNEDYFFSFFITSYNPFFKVPGFAKALKFSFDENPQDAFSQNNYQLPMGCHAWPKYKNFWQKYIQF